MNKICVYAICKNEEKFVDKWLDNMSEADYIVVLDTGSTDKTFEKLKNDPRVTKVAQKIYSKEEWRFDVARNDSLELVPEDANILLCTDLDEQFEPGWGDVIRNNWTEATTRGHYRYAWSHNAINEPTDIFIYDKLHDKSYRWVYPVHEILAKEENTGSEVVVDLADKVFLHHYQDLSKDRKSYFDLLELSVKEHPDDSHCRMLLAREYLIQNKLESALDTYLDTLHMPDIDNPEKRLVLLECLGRCGDIFILQKNYDEAKWYYQEWIKEDYTYREPYYNLAEIANEEKMYTLAEAYVKAADTYCTRKNNWVERADSWVSQRSDILGVTYFFLGKYKEALENITETLKHRPDDPRLLKNKIACLEALAGGVNNGN